MVRSRSSGSSHSHTWSSIPGYTDKPQNSSRWYYRSRPAGNGYNDNPSSIPQEQHYFTQRLCELHLQRYEKYVQKFGRDSLASTSTRELLTDNKCGAYVDLDKPLRVPPKPLYITQRHCELHFERYEELVLTFGRDSLVSTSIRDLLIDECGAYVDPDKPSSVPQERRYRPTPFQCKLHLQKFEELVQKFGRDSLAVTTNRELLIEKCGLGSDFDKPSCRSPK